VLAVMLQGTVLMLQGTGMRAAARRYCVASADSMHPSEAG
jgi:hypothetical protein